MEQQRPQIDVPYLKLQTQFLRLTLPIHEKGYRDCFIPAHLFLTTISTYTQYLILQSISFIVEIPSTKFNI